MRFWILTLGTSLVSLAGVPGGVENQSNGWGGAAAMAGIGIALTLIGYVRRQE
jgi:hypothetical protein